MLRFSVIYSISNQYRSFFKILKRRVWLLSLLAWKFCMLSLIGTWLSMCMIEPGVKCHVAFLCNLFYIKPVGLLPLPAWKFCTLSLIGTWWSMCNGKCLGLIQQDRPLMLFLVKDINLEWSSTLDILFFKSTWGIVKYLRSTPDTQTPFQGPYYIRKHFLAKCYPCVVYQFPYEAVYSTWSCRSQHLCSCTSARLALSNNNSFHSYK